MRARVIVTKKCNRKCKGLKTLEDVPERLRKQVEKILGGEA